ncbi:LapA family protein [Nocardioides zeae]
MLLLLLVVFIAQNTEQTTVRFLGFEGRAPLAVSLLIASAAGILLTALAGSLRIWQLRRRTRKEVGREPRRGSATADLRPAGRPHSHSMVPGGLLVTSSTTRLTSATSLVMRVEMRSSTS